MEHHGADGRGAGARVGQRLATERMAQGITLEDVAARTRVPLRTLEVLESGDTKGLPALTYTAGFVRSYGDLLGLDGTELARAFRAEAGQAPRAPVSQAYEVADPAHVPTRLLAIIGIVVALLIAGGYAIWRGDGLFGGSRERARLAAGTTPSPATEAPAAGAIAPATTPAGPVTAGAPAGPVTVAATQDVWLKIHERDGRSLYMGVMKAGESFAVPADAADPLIRTGRPEAVAITVGGQTVPPIGPADTLVKDVSLKREALLARAVATPLVPPPATPGAVAP